MKLSQIIENILKHNYRILRDIASLTPVVLQSFFFSQLYDLAQSKECEMRLKLGSRFQPTLFLVF